MGADQYQIRLLEMQKAINELFRKEQKTLDDEKIREAKNKNGGPKVELTEEQRAVIEGDIPPAEKPDK